MSPAPSNESERYEQARRELLDLVQRVGGSEGSLPIFGAPRDYDNETVLRLDGETWCLEFFERGGASPLVMSPNFEDIAFAILQSLTQGIATSWEFRHRVPGIDTRRTWFPVQLELFERVGEPWRTRMRETQAKILSLHPFIDAP